MTMTKSKVKILKSTREKEGSLNSKEQQSDWHKQPKVKEDQVLKENIC